MIDYNYEATALLLLYSSTTELLVFFCIYCNSVISLAAGYHISRLNIMRILFFTIFLIVSCSHEEKVTDKNLIVFENQKIIFDADLTNNDTEININSVLDGEFNIMFIFSKNGYSEKIF